ncbi:MAG: chemotaxis response regulator protein-glutamate methylesterase [Polyangiaceae bacterium]|jgi:two-component system chemotaxis response regulator CheB
MATPENRVRVLVADDSALMRRTLTQLIQSDPGLEVVGTARDGEDVVIKAREIRPDVISMDINMPKLDGISALQLIVHEQICPVVMMSSLTQHGAQTTFEALELGAFDFVPKPDGTVSADLSSVAADLRRKLKAAASSSSSRRTQRRPERVQRKPSPPAVAPERPEVRGPTSGMKAVVIGISTGGPATIVHVLPKLAADVPAAIFLVQHMPGSFTGAFARRLDETCAVKVEEATAGTEVRAGHCYVGRGDYQLTVYRSGPGHVVLRTPTKPDTLFKPSVNVTMESVRSAFGKNTIGVLMTGIGDDGADEMVKIKASGGYTIAESAESAVVYGMPREAIERGGAHAVCPAWDIAEAIVSHL